MSYIAACAIVEKNNTWAYNVFFMISFLAIGYYFYDLLIGRLKKQLVIFFALAGFIYSVERNFFQNGFSNFDSLSYSILSIEVVFFAFMYLHQLFTHIDEKKIYYDVNFWIISGYLLFFIAGFFIFATYYSLTHKITSTYTHHERALMTLLWGVHNVLLFLSSFITLLGSVWIAFRKKSTSSSSQVFFY